MYGVHVCIYLNWSSICVTVLLLVLTLPPQLHPPPGRAESAETDGRQGVLPAPSSSRGSSPPPLPPAPLSTGDPAEETAPAGQGTGEETV